jgi:FtsP/CotA-like multicopper oxidase with cupredoxin domain
MGGHPHPRDTVHPGGKFVYEFDVLDRASPFWFHPHPDKWTAYQVYYGLAGLYFITDDTEARLGLDSGELDVPLVIQDRVFDSNNQFTYLSENTSMMSMMQGFLGNRILVNGHPDYVQTLRPGAYRLRFYNGSNARIYKLAWQDGTPLTIIGTDGGLLARPVQLPFATLAPAQRLDVWVDLTSRPAGTDLVLQSLAFSSGMCGMMGGGCGMGCCSNGAGGAGMGRMGAGMNNAPSLPQGAAFPILKIHLEGNPKPALVLPHTLSPYEGYWLRDAVNQDSPRTIVLGMNMMAFTLNGRVFDMEAIADDENVPFNQVEVWEFVNQTMIAHPMHIHNVQFNVIARQPGFGGYSTLSPGFVDDGWLDTVLVMPGERVRLLVKFNTYQGMYMYHCHILEHEVMGMMRNVMVGEGMM